MTATAATSTALSAALSAALAASIACGLITGCATAPRGPAEATPPAPAKPAGREPAPTSPELAPLSFMTGHWVTQLPNGMVSEELWMPARGRTMLGSFRQTRPDGRPAFFEFTQIVVEDAQITLRQIHVHGSFDTDARRKDPMTLRLAESSAGKAVFVPIDDAAKAAAGDLASVTYALADADTLSLRIESKPVAQPAAKTEGEQPAKKPVVIEISMKRAR